MSNKMKWHPIAELFPMMPADQYEALKQDIRENGVQSCGLLYQGQILDGRNRYKACCELGISFTWEEVELSEDAASFDPLKHVISHNLHRRHLEKSQRAMIAAKMANLKHGEVGNGRGVDTQNCGSTPVEDAAKLLDVSPRSVTAAKHVIEHGSKDLVEAVEQRQVTASLAEKLCKTVEDKREQSELVANGVKAVRKRVGGPTPEEIANRKRAKARKKKAKAELDAEHCVNSFAMLKDRIGVMRKIVGLLEPYELIQLADFIKESAGVEV